MDKSFWPSYSSSDKTYMEAEAEAVEFFSLLLPQKKDRFHIPDVKPLLLDGIRYQFVQSNSR